MIIDPEKNGKIVGGTVLDFEPTMVFRTKLNLLTAAYQVYGGIRNWSHLYVQQESKESE
jgi:hypothetical protein